MDLKDRWGAIVNCIADLLGPKAEVVLHDVSCPDRSVIMIRNGHVTGRTIGAPLTDLGFYMLRESEDRIETLGIYRSKTDDGKLLQCNAANLRDARGKIEAILCINIDITGESTKQGHNQKLPIPAEHYQTNIDQVIETMISEASRAVNGSLTRDLKFEVVSDMDARGVFLARGSVRKVASALEIAAPTIYKYIQLGRRRRTSAKKARAPEEKPASIILKPKHDSGRRNGMKKSARN
jgi:predicted transcriptional regulator YheO